MNTSRILTTIDTHTAGGPTRTIIGGIPPLAGQTITEKMDYFRTHLDPVRKMLMWEPRGHRDMSGAVIDAPSHSDADIAAFFLTTSGYLRACVHSSIGLATAGLETGFIKKAAQKNDEGLKLETPSGLVTFYPEYRGDKVQSVAIQTPPAFVHTEVAAITLDDGIKLTTSIVYSGVFFILLDVKQLGIKKSLDGSYIGTFNASELSKVGARVLEEANRCFSVQHPENPAVNSIDLVMIYQDHGDNHARDIVVGRSGGLDRTPCGAGTGAKITKLFTEGRLGANKDFVLESFIGTQFVGQVLQSAKVGAYRGAVPQIKGSAFITGMHQFVLDTEDPLTEGFLF